ncbi:hypothetical protein ASPBRDRAFT_123273 [Aspergillus brasiliensis CBS 101740]|uniref:Uncharacterized protein n=1 Tax=Aspergillus brasiliensis (strain CBS 101740 / IMI 381727 / IBT 21946) TaxID=767769 RepID=A0A1L9ULF6_ASPBC|nr:hypothetical protein ASPBRDRAFT_123273 [Aspergillus brasiliensis CBS 101740]
MILAKKLQSAMQQNLRNTWQELSAVMPIPCCKQQKYGRSEHTLLPGSGGSPLAPCYLFTVPISLPKLFAGSILLAPTMMGRVASVMYVIKMSDGSIRATWVVYNSAKLVWQRSSRVSNRRACLRHDTRFPNRGRSWRCDRMICHCLSSWFRLTC